MESYQVAKRTSLAEMLDQSSCAVCQSIIGKSYGHPQLGTSTVKIKESQFTVCSPNQKQLWDDQNQQTRSTHCHVKGKEESEVVTYLNLQSHGKHSPDHCFLSSSVYYGGPDELYHILQGRNEAQDDVKMAVKQLEQATDPFQHEYSTRGNWWEGSLYY
ncbi:uncharacterized protein LOC131028536 [Cryptomeria japonica]|uniref:uncharacterized protein LOC131028536 n=1 Tax=Cryptomeria japonica TaxID=3369 RepID=UPI0027DA4A7E|nr:uncharacterized protein LOC131028536 [Cryptomeria japonica]